MDFRHPPPLRIYLADLTYSTLSLANEAFPLNIGFVASYCKKIFGKDVDIRLFKYLDDLDRELHKHPPHVLGMSNYPWNQDLGLNFFNMMKELSPDTIRVMGGPSIPQKETDRDKFIQR
ncbi:MAG TPA: radical SAM protein, partial [Flavobacteriales bacterium]|nr:radical SAM protein [Flavobacteriales bacterium]